MEILTIILGTLGGASAVVTGLFAYFGNLRLEKYKADLEATNSKLKGLLESSVHVSKSQFDKEFSIYQHIWVLLVSLRARTLSLRPRVDFGAFESTEEETVNKRLKSFNEAFYSFRDGMENNKPFYAQSVYESLCQIFDLCNTESIEYQYKEPGNNRKYWESSKENSQKIIAEIDACCELIRNRISSLSVAQ